MTELIRQASLVTIPNATFRLANSRHHGNILCCLERNAPEEIGKFLTFSLIYGKTILWIAKGNQAENWINPTLHYFMYTLKELQLHLIASFVLG